VVAQALCADEEEEADYGAAGRTRAQKQSRISKSAVAPPLERIKHDLVLGTSIGVGNTQRFFPSCTEMYKFMSSEILELIISGFGNQFCFS
jgi:hypothetical protein